MVLGGKSYAFAECQHFFPTIAEHTVTLTDFTLHFSCCFTKLLHSDFILLLNSFTLQEKCY